MDTQLEKQSCRENSVYCKYGAQALLKLLPTLEAQIDGVERSEDIEFLHKMRVASRRIRVAMPLFKNCYPEKHFKKWLNEIKEITKFLGEARDLDVQIVFLQNYFKTHYKLSNNAGVTLLHDSLVSRRNDIQKTVVSELEELKNSAVLEEIRDFSFKIHPELMAEPLDTREVLEDANDQISAKLSNFLLMEHCVHKEHDVLCHHQMRIRAKWLRYTMEAFSSLYKEKLLQEIKTIKRFQDLLGEIHDCDVWAQCIPKFIAQIETRQTTPQNRKERAENETESLLEFLEFVKERRKKYYGDFVQLWDERITQDVLEQLERTTDTGPVTAIKATKEALLNPETKIALLADIHGNLHALKAVFRDARRRGVNVFLNAGDLTGFGVFPNGVIKLLKSNKAVSVIGNFDLDVIGKERRGNSDRQIAVKFTRKELSKPCQDYLCSLPRKIVLETAGKSLLLVHGSPEAIDEHIYSDTSKKRLRELCKISQTDVIIVGHSHEQFLKEIDKISFVNPGSVGRPYDKNPQAAYAIASFNPFCVEFIRVDYPVRKAAHAMRKKKLPESFAQMLLRGLSPEAIIKEDEARNIEMELSCTKVKESARKVALSYQQDPQHSEQVNRIALKIFDCLKNLHNLGKRERCWLECAALLHDIGLSVNALNHNKNSLRLILDDTQIPFSSVEKRIVGSIARYHRKGFPKEKHYNLVGLDKETKLKVKMLSSILRVADGLDFTHQSIVDDVEVTVETKKINFECRIHSNPNVEQQAVNRKKDLLERVFERKLVLTWKTK